MSPSSDIETLFGHFGGNAGDYQEIGRENEAGTARTRWPLLVTLDLKQTPIPAIAQHRERLAHHADNAEAQHSEPQNAADPASVADTAASGMQALRSKAPLFARPHRRNVPPVANVIKADAPRGGDRFGAVPEVSTPAAASMQSAMPVASVAAVPPVFSRPAAISPVATPTFASGAVPPAASRPAIAPTGPTWANPLAAVAQPVARPATQAAIPAMPIARTPAPAATQPPTILGRLFAAAAPQSAPTMPSHAGEARPAELTSVFDRLRGASSNTAAPVSAPHSWLTNGPRRS
ncbi:MAG: cellulose biosynthesis protein BcsP [Paraburkholderia sp.]|uniref:cellulose biosynthesis protein BcsP n=1 Tax=Paraburkholderia sp. TaxID=1926495 RepID=UPI003C65488A